MEENRSHVDEEGKMVIDEILARNSDIKGICEITELALPILAVFRGSKTDSRGTDPHGKFRKILSPETVPRLMNDPK